MWRPRRIVDWIALALFLSFVSAAAVSAAWVSRYAIKVHRLTRGVGDTVFYSADGQPWFRLDEQRHDVALADISPDLQHAVVAVEDRRFYYHPGIDPIGLARAAVRDVRARERVEGGSTLTQQLARTLFLSNVRTYGRKAKEAALALLMEEQLTKNQILELYLNRVYLSAGVYGVETMSEHLFRKPARSLTLPEAALIAGLIQSPSALSPWSNYEGALDRSHVVLDRMREQGFITAAEAEAARRARPRIQPYRQPSDSRAAWAKEFLRQQFRSEFGGDHPPDWQVHTSFRTDVQDAAERAVASGLDRLKVRGLEAALVAIDPQTGDLLAMVGGANYARSTFNRATRTRRQPGSAFKPILYAAALDHGYSPVSVIPNLRAISTPGDPEWLPRNADNREPEELPIRAALIESNNAAAASLQQQLGSKPVLQLAKNVGLHGLPDVPSLALGTGLVTPLDLTAAYTMFPSGGSVVRPRGIIDVYDANGNEVSDHPVIKDHVISEEAAFQMVTLLRDAVDRGTGAAARTLGVRGPVGGKTGTTDQYHDAWFVGFSSAVVAGVWVGFDQPSPIGRDAYAARIAVPIWADFMKRTARALPAREFAVPRGLREVELCSVSYLKPVEGCPVYTEYFKDGDSIPSRLCPIHRGTLKERATRAVTGFFRSLGSAIADIFRR
ncbi:MAG TPA: PBP1A family penicillin-binding protein [Nitrospirales bacterium]|nr:PBP1A family penicillin-binding protein [Nitrospirales bacterium]